MFALADCNNFYASCERIFRPDLVGKPIVVLSNNDGCVISRSNEAKTAGIPMGAAAFKFEKIFLEKKIQVFSSNYPLYGDMSDRVMGLLANFTPEIEVYSIDEAFLKFDGFDRIDFEKYGIEIRDTVSRSSGIPISLGIASTKTLAKVANRIAKKYMDKTKGSYVIDSEEKRLKALKWLKVEEVWGVVRGHAKRLNKAGIYTAYELTQQSDEWVRKNMSVVGLRLKQELEGVSTLDLEKLRVKKNIATTRSFETNYTDFEQIKERVSTFTISCAEKLRKQQLNCNAIHVFLSTNRHRRDLNQYKKGIAIRLPFPTNSSIELSKFATKALKLIYKRGYEYKRAGVIVTNINSIEQQQIELFENSDPRHSTLMATMDKLNRTIGEQKIKLGSQDLERTWKMKQERLSPRYTTRLDEIIKVKV